MLTRATAAPPPRPGCGVVGAPRDPRGAGSSRRPGLGSTGGRWSGRCPGCRATDGWLSAGIGGRGGSLRLCCLRARLFASTGSNQSTGVKRHLTLSLLRLRHGKLVWPGGRVVDQLCKGHRAGRREGPAGPPRVQVRRVPVADGPASPGRPLGWWPPAGGRPRSVTPSTSGAPPARRPCPAGCSRADPPGPAARSRPTSRPPPTTSGRQSWPGALDRRPPVQLGPVSC